MLNPTLLFVPFWTKRLPICPRSEPVRAGGGAPVTASLVFRCCLRAGGWTARRRRSTRRDDHVNRIAVRPPVEGTAVDVHTQPLGPRNAEAHEELELRAAVHADDLDRVVIAVAPELLELDEVTDLRGRDRALHGHHLPDRR